MSTAPGAKPPVSIDSEETKRPTGSDGEARRRAASISDGVASPVGSWETELIGRPHAEQYRPLSETSAEQEGHFLAAIEVSLLLGRGFRERTVLLRMRTADQLRLPAPDRARDAIGDRGGAAARLPVRSGRPFRLL